MNMSTLEQIDLSDLDLLDDDKAHARCLTCYPGDVALKPIVALCGVTTIIQNRGQQHHIAPPNACEECKKAWQEPCRGCGRSAV